MLPGSWGQALVIAAAVVPGFVYQISRRKVGGPDPDHEEVMVRILRAIASSAVFACIYALLLGSQLEPYLVDASQTAEAARHSVGELALWALVLVLLVPWLVARVVFYLTTAQWWGEMWVWIHEKTNLKRPWDPTPSGWDFAFRDRQAGWVRVLRPDGRWMGGFFGEASFASSYPDARDLFIEVGYEMTDAGAFTGEISAPNGLYVRCDDVVLVDFIADTEDDQQQLGPAATPQEVRNVR